jgi:hypothetical protein
MMRWDMIQDGWIEVENLCDEMGYDPRWLDRSGKFVYCDRMKSSR